MPKKKPAKITIQRRTPGKRIDLSEDHESQPFVHPMEELLDPLSQSNVFGELRNSINNLSFELTGKSLTRNEMPVLKELFELLINEVRTAAQKSGPINNLPEFALNHFKK